MKALGVLLLGGAVGFLAVALWKATHAPFNPNAGISPTTGGVELPPGIGYGPPDPNNVTVVEGLN